MTDVAQERRSRRAPLHFRRIELKYVLPARRVQELVDRISPYMEADPFMVAGGRPSYAVTSLYFDSFDLQSLFAKEAGWLSRRRIRLRAYDDKFVAGSTAFLEVKRRHDFLVSKDRLPLQLTPDVLARPTHARLLRDLLRTARELDQPATDEALVVDAWFNLQPTALVAYDRIAFVSGSDNELRLTIDRDLRGVWKPRALAGRQLYSWCGVHPLLPRLMAYGTHRPRGPQPARANDYLVVELKFAHSIPRWMHQVVQVMQLERSAYSKYAWVVRNLLPNLYEANLE